MGFFNLKVCKMLLILMFVIKIKKSFTEYRPYLHKVLLPLSLYAIDSKVLCTQIGLSWSCYFFSFRIIELSQGKHSIAFRQECIHRWACNSMKCNSKLSKVLVIFLLLLLCQISRKRHYTLFVCLVFEHRWLGVRHSS